MVFLAETYVSLAKGTYVLQIKGSIDVVFVKDNCFSNLQIHIIYSLFYGHSIRRSNIHTLVYAFNLGTIPDTQNNYIGGSKGTF